MRARRLVQRELGPHGRAETLLARDTQMASECFHPVGEPSEARSLAGVGTADSVVGDLDHEHAVIASEVNLGSARRGVLGDIRQRFRDHVKCGSLDRLWQPLGRKAVDLHRQWGARRERLDGRREAAVGEDRRMDSAGELTELLQTERELFTRSREQIRGARRIGC
jgi:hypothetical protein